jgi:metal-responsive CopG/Arc/MetJ family transcriptional regulator
MPGQRAEGIVNVSFTMPAEIAAALEKRARHDMTNKSEIVRRAILAYLPPEEASRIRSSVMESSERAEAADAPRKKVTYRNTKKKPKP